MLIPPRFDSPESLGPRPEKPKEKEKEHVLETSRTARNNLKEGIKTLVEKNQYAQYKVQSGETLSHIALKHKDKVRNWEDLWAFHNAVATVKGEPTIANPHRIKIGQIIYIPTSLAHPLQAVTEGSWQDPKVHQEARTLLRKALKEGALDSEGKIQIAINNFKSALPAGASLTSEEKKSFEAALKAAREEKIDHAQEILEALLDYRGQKRAAHEVSSDIANIATPETSSFQRFKKILILDKLKDLGYSTDAIGAPLSFIGGDASWDTFVQELAKEDQIQTHLAENIQETNKNREFLETTDEYDLGGKAAQTILQNVKFNLIALPTSVALSLAIGNPAPTLVFVAHVGRIQLGLGQPTLTSRPEQEYASLGKFYAYGEEIILLREELKLKKAELGNATAEQKTALESEIKSKDDRYHELSGKQQLLLNSLEKKRLEKGITALKANYNPENGTRLEDNPIREKPNQEDIILMTMLDREDAHQYAELINNVFKTRKNYYENDRKPEDEAKFKDAQKILTDFVKNTFTKLQEKSNQIKDISTEKDPQKLKEALDNQKKWRHEMKTLLEELAKEDTPETRKKEIHEKLIPDLSEKMKQVAYEDPRSLNEMLRDAERKTARKVFKEDQIQESLTYAVTQAHHDQKVDETESERILAHGLTPEQIAAIPIQKEAAERSIKAAEENLAQLKEEYNEHSTNWFMRIFTKDKELTSQNVEKDTKPLDQKIAELNKKIEAKARELRIGVYVKDVPHYSYKDSTDPQKREKYAQYWTRTENVIRLTGIPENHVAPSYQPDAQNLPILLTQLLGKYTTFNKNSPATVQDTMSELSKLLHNESSVRADSKFMKNVKREKRVHTHGKSHTPRKIDITSPAEKEAYKLLKQEITNLINIFRGARLEKIPDDFPKLFDRIKDDPPLKIRLLESLRRIFDTAVNFDTVEERTEKAKLEHERKLYTHIQGEEAFNIRAREGAKQSISGYDELIKYQKMIKQLAQEKEVDQDVLDHLEIVGKHLELTRRIKLDFDNYKDLDLENLLQDGRVSLQVPELFKSIEAQRCDLRKTALEAQNIIYQFLSDQKPYDQTQFNNIYIASLNKQAQAIENDHQNLKSELAKQLPQVRAERRQAAEENVEREAQTISANPDYQEKIIPAFEQLIFETATQKLSIHEIQAKIDQIFQKSADKKFYRPQLTTLICQKINQLALMKIPVNSEMFKTKTALNTEIGDPAAALKFYEIATKFNQHILSNPNPSGYGTWMDFKNFLKTEYQIEVKTHATPAMTSPLYMVGQEVLQGFKGSYINMLMLQLPQRKDPTLPEKEKPPVATTIMQALDEIGLHIDEPELMRALAQGEYLTKEQAAEMAKKSGKVNLETLNTGTLGVDIPYYPATGKNAPFAFDGGYKLTFRRSVNLAVKEKPGQKTTRTLDVDFNIFLRGACFNVNIPLEGMINTKLKEFITPTIPVVAPEKKPEPIVYITTAVGKTIPLVVPVYWYTIGAEKPTPITDDTGGGTVGPGTPGGPNPGGQNPSGGGGVNPDAFE